MRGTLPFVAISISLHALLFFLLLWDLHTRPAPQPTEVLFVEKGEKGERDKSRGKGSAQGKGRFSSLSKLTPKMTVPDAAATGLNPERDALAKGSSEWPEGSWGRRGGDFGEIVNFLKYDSLREEINGLLNYPYILARRGFSGTVNARLIFTDNSSCDWKRIRITSHERHLRIYILTLLKKLCSLEVVKRLKAGRKDEIDLSFQFLITDEFTPKNLQGASDFIVGNVLAFRRTAPKSVFEYQIGPIRGVWFAPAIALDFPWLVEKWDYYVNDIDPMAPFRE